MGNALVMLGSNMIEKKSFNVTMVLMSRWSNALMNCRLAN